MMWSLTMTGRAVDLRRPRPDDIDLAEIGMALSQACRYAGNCRHFYSTAEHSVLIARWLRARFPDEPDLALGGLLHDGHEAYTGDLTWPIQRVLWAASAAAREAYREVVGRFDVLIADTAEIDVDCLHEERVRAADVAILLDERRAVLGSNPRPWDRAVEESEPLGVRIEGWHPARARHEWLLTLEELQAARGVDWRAPW